MDKEGCGGRGKSGDGSEVEAGRWEVPGKDRQGGRRRRGRSEGQGEADLGGA